MENPLFSLKMREILERKKIKTKIVDPLRIKEKINNIQVKDA